MSTPLIKNFSIFNAWGDNRLTELKFRKNVTFITGFNGTGKTTLLELLNFSLSDPMSISPSYKDWCTKILLKQNIALFSFDLGTLSTEKQEKINASLKGLDTQSALEELSLIEFHDKVLKKIDDKKIKNKNKNKNNFVSPVVSNNSKTDVDPSIAARVTFARVDNPSKNKDVKEMVSPVYYREEVFMDADRPYTNHPDTQQTNIYDKSILLDFTLRELLIDFLSKEKEEAIKNDQVNKENASVFNEINSLLSGKGIDKDVAFKLKQNFSSLIKIDAGYSFEAKVDVISKFESIVNEFFECTGKTICRDSRGLLAFKDLKSNVIESSKLSRGEKNILILLILAFLSQGENKVFILDEPDLTLHIEWQKKIISKLQELAPKSQFIIATHSPALFMNDIDFDVINMMDVTNYE
ncbi:TPA: AAA family ATPase [Enterobacter roggenkampii]|nr:AAA family ATPase [Enterobacter roggenkampii]HDS4671797.1 AAA family ATPase [Enterobacter roggenkampii]HDS5523961.1 AAA family ATPase [Enterobacter roggenkampii]HDT1059939.1 AAA family ATPase [Enterobacter roggenkampii]